MLYACALAAMSTLTFAITATRGSGEMRWQAGLLASAAVCLTAALPLEVFRANPAAGSGLSSLLGIIALTAVTVAVLRFRAFDVAPVARDMLVEQTTHGMMVLDEMRRVVDANPAARRLLGVPSHHVIGRDALELLKAWPALLSSVLAGGGEHVEVTFADLDASRIYDAAVTPFLDPSGRKGLQLIVWFDVTETRAARAEVERQRSALAASVERDRVARELHDGIAQALASINVRAVSARRSLEAERPEETYADLSSIIEVTRDANEEIRDFLVGARGLGKPGTDLWSALADYAERYRALHGMQVYLAFPEDVADIKLDPVTQVQLLRIIQESLSNVRRHSGTRAASISVARWPDAVRIVIHDDGVGFDPQRVPGAGEGHLGLSIMRERAEEVGARFDVTSAPGCGTAIFIEVPQNG
jgi:signal transduction histidine kinase